MRINNVLGAVAAIVMLSTSTFAVAEGEHDNAIEARQAMFQLYNFTTGILGDMAQGKRDYDADVAKEAAENLLAAANLGQSQMWPPGSDSETEGNAPTRALPNIWSTFPAITEKADALKAAAAALAPVAGNGLEALQGAMGDVGDSCKGCHKEYRARRR